MKLSNFYDKENKKPNVKAQITLSNGRLEEDLDSERRKNKHLEERNEFLNNEQDDLKQQIAILEENRKSLINELDENKDALKISEAESAEINKIRDVIPSLQSNIKQLTADKEGLNTSLEKAQQNNIQQNGDLSNLKQLHKNITEENTQFRTEIEQNRKDVSSFQARAEQFKEKFNGIQQVLNSLTSEYKETQRSRNNLWDQAAYWEAKAHELGQRVESIENIEVKLRHWIEDLQEDSTQSKDISKHMKRKLNKLTTLVSDMGKTINDLTSDKDYLSQVNAALKKELAKPKFMSMGAIAKREGFVMPTGKENIRTKYLGNSAPTLVKFKTKEENNAR